MFGTSLKLCCFWSAIRGRDCQCNYNFLIVAWWHPSWILVWKTEFFPFFFLALVRPEIPDRFFFFFYATQPQGRILIKPVGADEAETTEDTEISKMSCFRSAEEKFAEFKPWSYYC